MDASDSAERGRFLDKLKRSNEVEITVTGRKSKKKISTPVWFVLDGEKVILLPIKGSESNWYKNLADDPQIGLKAEDKMMTFKARLVRDPERVKTVVDKFRMKYPSGWERSQKYYTKRDAYAEVPI
jgi:deazaflavin-dependent oxidoreductase (nitroreductase family)